MNAIELKAALDGLGVSDRRYLIVDGATWLGYGNGGSDEFQLERAESAWVVSYVERGQVEERELFGTEDEACRYLLDRLTPKVRPKRKLTEEEVARKQESVAKQRADYEAQLARKRLNDA